MKGSNSTIIIAAVLLSALAVLWLWPRHPGAIALPGRITTVAAGYSFALQLKERMNRTAHLTSVLIDLERRGEQFHAPQIIYGFDSPKPNGRVFAVALDNARREAFPVLDVPNSLDPPHIPPRNLAPLDLSAVKDFAAVLEIAKTNGLSEFCALTTPEQGKVSLQLANDSSGCPVWGVIGDGWDENGPIADLAITIDARNGAVLSHTLTKAVNRP